MNYEKHATALGILLLLMGLLGLIGLFIVFLVFALAGAVTGSQVPTGEVPPFVPLIPVAIGSVIALVILVMTLPNLIGAYGLFQGKSWASVWVLVAGILNLVSFPIGTAVGVYAIWFFFQPEVEGKQPG